MFSSFSFTGFISNIISSISTYLNYLFNLSAPEFMYTLFTDFGWLIVVILLIKAVPIIYLNFINNRYMAKQRYVLLAIDVPRDTEQTVRAAENLITALSGGHWAECFREKWLEGQVQRSFSLEIVSIDGHIQFLIHTPVGFRVLVEAAVQSQYPDSEITEVEDYTKEFPDKFPDEKYNWKGGEFGPVKKNWIPIKTYKDFEDDLDKDFKDPLILLLENMSRLEKGEQVWFQIVVRPTGFDWVKGCDAAVDKILGKKPKGKSGSLGKAVAVPGAVVGAFAQAIVGYTPMEEAKGPEARKMMELTPGETELIKKIQDKKHKMGFYCKLRVLYLAERSNFKPWRLGGIMGSIKQYNSNSANSIRPYWDEWGTGSNYYFDWRRKRKVAFKQTIVMNYYKNRDAFNGYPPYLWTADEIASLYHFPNTVNLTTSLLKRTDSRKGEAPVNLPIATEKEMRDETKVEDQGVVENWEDLKEVSFDIDNDYFEERFAKDKDAYKIKQTARKEKQAHIAEVKAEADLKSEKIEAEIREEIAEQAKETVIEDKAASFFATDRPSVQVDEQVEEFEKKLETEVKDEPPANLPI